MSPRVRLMLMYGSLFLVTGAVLLASVYMVLRTFTPQRRGEPPGPIVLEGPDGTTVTVPAPPVPDEQMQANIAAAANEARNELFRRMLAVSGVALGGLALVSFPFGWWMAGRILTPMEAALAAQRRFVGDASHELRTPLATIPAQLEVALGDPGDSAGLRRAAEQSLRATERSERLVDSLLTLARVDAAPVAPQRIDLATVAGDVTGALSPEADRAGLRVDLDLGAAPVTADTSLAERLVGNLVENAIRHNVGPGGWILVRTGISADQAVLEVVNPGPVLSDQDVALLCEPFHRGARSSRQSGAGLGLAIVSAIVERFGGRLDLRAPAEGGLDVTVSLPHH